MKCLRMAGGDGHEQLQSQRDRALAILDAIGASYLLSAGGEILEVSDGLCEMLGFRRDELIGVTLPWPFWPPEGVTAAMDLRDNVVGNGYDVERAEPFEVPLMRKDGTRFIAEVRIAPARLPDGAVLGWVSTARDISERRDYEVELERLVTHDPLTSLANRRLFDQRLEAEIANAIRHERPLAVAILDLDHFKAVNDLYGHPVGDQALQGVSVRLGAVLRKGDLLARVGGEEFAWILPEIPSEGALVAAERAREAIASTPFRVQVGSAAAGSPRTEVGLDLTISIGVAMRADLRDAAQLYERADQALYRAKRGGRNRSVLWSSASSSPLA
jgi:diguanylate cyclase (GGDEF)-like protein/PAS domain S-box-containing protein